MTAQQKEANRNLAELEQKLKEEAERKLAMQNQMSELNEELQNAKKSMTMKELLADLQRKLEVEIENLRVTRDQKTELSTMLSKSQMERKDAIQKMKDAEQALEDAKKERDKQTKQGKENYDRC